MRVAVLKRIERGIIRQQLPHEGLALVRSHGIQVGRVTRKAGQIGDPYSRDLAPLNVRFELFSTPGGRGSSRPAGPYRTSALPHVRGPVQSLAVPAL